MRRRVGLLISLLALLLFATVGCLALGEPEVETVSAEDINKMAPAVASYAGSYKVPPQWMVGVVFQVYRTISWGLDSDEYNKVRIRVYVPNGIINIIPCSAYQEEAMAKAYNAGDIIGFKTPANNVTAKQDEIRLCHQDVMVLEKNGLSKVK